MEDTREQIINLLKDGIDDELAAIFEIRNYPPNFSFGPHTHKNLEINFVIKGNCAMQFPGQKVYFKKSDCMIIYPNVEHYFTVADRPTSLVQLEFKMDIFPELVPCPGMEKSLIFLYNILTNSQQYLKIINNQQINQLIDQTVRELNLKRNNYQTMIRLLYAQLFILISRHIKETLKMTYPSGSPVIKEAIDFMNNHFTDNITISRVAEHCKVSERYVRAVFKKATTLSPIEYLNQLKINKARELLFDKNLSVKDIAYMGGFSNPQYFTRRFKASCGLSPSGFRKLNDVKYNNL